MNIINHQTLPELLGDAIASKVIHEALVELNNSGKTSKVIFINDKFWIMDLKKLKKYALKPSNIRL